jgi:SnoaL-like domain
MPNAKELLHSNLHEVFSERNPERRRAAIERTYTEDVTFIDPDGEFVGRQALSDQAQKLLDGVLAGFVFEEDGPRYVGTDTAALAWRFGPAGNAVARGIDILTIRDGRCLCGSRGSKCHSSEVALRARTSSLNQRSLLNRRATGYRRAHPPRPGADTGADSADCA